MDLHLPNVSGGLTDMYLLAARDATLVVRTEDAGTVMEDLATVEETPSGSGSCRLTRGGDERPLRP